MLDGEQNLFSLDTWYDKTHVELTEHVDSTIRYYLNMSIYKIPT